MTKQMSTNATNSYSDIHLEILVELTEQLKLSDSKYDDAVEKYKSVAKWLNTSDNSIFNDAEIYIQGSVRLGTTVKPYGKNEYDIDLVVHLPNLDKSYSSEDVHNAIGARLNESEVYKKKRSPLKRGWRINYFGDFHLDITPAIPDNECNNSCPINKHYAEYVPDSKLKKWKESNPRGYAGWFHDIDHKTPMFANDSKTVFSVESRTIEDAPDQHEFKGVLKRTIQLLKRHRDIYFNETRSFYKEWAPISILITTLAANAYKELLSGQVVYTPIVLIKSIIRDMKKHVNVVDDVYYVGNPTNLKENFAEKWNESDIYEMAFDMWITAVSHDIEAILNSKGLDNVGRIINKSFGGNYGNKVLDSISESVSTSRGLGVLSGLLLLNEEADAKISKNTFYGAK